MAFSDPTQPNFWNERYETEKTPWDFHGVPSALRQFMQTNPRPRRVLVPGCGTGYEIRAFLDAGWNVCGIDFSPAAIKHAETYLGEQIRHVVLGNFFHYPFEGKFDCIYERTFLCALPPDRWMAYAQRVKELLAPGGQLLGFFFTGPEEEPPPYPLGPIQAQELLRPELTLVEDNPVTDSLPLFAGKERWQIWEKQ